VLIEDGILVGYLQDTLNARLMGVPPTGNGRRESFAHLPLPRMTNTACSTASRDPQEIIKSVKKGSTPPTSAAARWTSPAASSCSRPPRPT
jgi:TldD protein